MIGWLLLLISAGLFIVHAYMTAGVEAAVFMAAVWFLAGGIWRKVEDAHEQYLDYERDRRIVRGRYRQIDRARLDTNQQDVSDA